MVEAEMSANDVVEIIKLLEKNNIDERKVVKEGVVLYERA